MMVDVAGKVVVITGSSKGIGRELIQAFAREKAKVVVHYFHSEEACREVYELINKNNRESIMVKADITKQDEVARLYRETLKTFGRVDVVINNAGICDDNPIQLMSEDQWKAVLDVNLTGAYLCSRSFSKAMVQQRNGKIINISSLKGQEGCAGQVNYSASKAGLIGFTKALAKELGRFNIAVNAVCPGFIVTDMNRHDEKKQETARKRSILPSQNDTALHDLINFIIFISSDSFSGISGRVFNLDSRLE